MLDGLQSHGLASLLLGMAMGSCARAGRVPAPQATVSVDTTIVFTQQDSEDQILKWGPRPPGPSHAPRSHPYDLQHQVVRLAFDWTRRAVNGLTDLSLAPRTDGLSSVDFDAVGLTIKRVSDSTGRALDHAYDGRILSVRFRVPLRKAAVVRVSIAYEAARPKVGVYWVGRRHIVWTQGKAEDNRYWLPTYDAPDDKATWEFFVRTAPGERAFAVGTLAGRREVEGGVEWHWVQDRPAPTYLMTVAAGPYTVVEDTSGPVHLSYWVYPEAANQAHGAFAATPLAIRLFGEKLGVPFPSQRFDAVVVPDFIFWDALESWRPAVTTTVLDDRMILEDERGWPGEERDLAIARLIAQEWFGKLVTPRDWRDAWLSEGFVHFMAQIYAEEAQGKWAATHVRTWANVGTFAADRDHRRPLVFDRWMYGPIEVWRTEHLQHRGAVVLHLLRHELGDSLFWQGMRHYVKTHAGGTVTTENFQTAMEEAAGRDLSRFFAQWVYGSGFPILHVAFTYDSAAREVTLTARQVQRRDSETGFFDAPVDIEILTDHGPIWRVFSLKAHELSEERIRLPSALRALQWDPHELLAFDVKFRRPTPLLVYQLEHGDDGARRQAIHELEMRAAGMEKGGAMMIVSDSTAAPPLPPAADPVAAAALLKAARSDSSTGVRLEAIQALGMLWDETAVATLLDLSHDPARETRGAAVMGLLGAPSQAAVERLRALATSEPDPAIRYMALEGVGAREPRLLLSAAQRMLANPSARDAEKADAMTLVAGSHLPEGWDIARRLLTAPEASRRIRQQASRSLSIEVFMSQFGQHAAGRQFVELLAPLLNSDDPSDRIVAARDIAAAKIPEARAALQGRKKVEVDARVITRIDESLQEIDRPDPPWPHQ